MAKDELRLPFPASLSQEVDRLFDELIHRPWGSLRTSADDWSPQIDLYETEGAFILEADLPGVQQPDVSVTVEQGSLVLRGKRTFTRAMNQRDFHYSERRSGSFIRRLQLPKSVDQAHIQAEFSEGVLRVTLPKLLQERKIGK